VDGEADQFISEECMAAPDIAHVEKKVENSKTGYLHLVIIYIVWGSTYLAIRVAVRDGSGFSPFVMGAMRVLAAAIILMVIGYLSRQRLKLTRVEFLNLFGSGLLLWTGGNGLVMLGEQKADSAVAALIIACTPIWVAIIEAILDRKVPSALLIGSLTVGTAGIVVLTMPLILTGLKAELLSILAIVLGSLSWAAGSVFQSRRQVHMAPIVSSGYQSLFGGLGFVVIALLLREPIPHPIPQAWLAWIYLVVFGSAIAFTSFVQVLRLLPTKIVVTYAYVNPIIAVILGWVILSEQITVWTIGGAVLVLLGVAGVFRAHGAVAH
jgi:drug/metabolite transporter (DMT)-like permease